MTTRRFAMWHLLALCAPFALSACKPDSNSKGIFMQKKIVVDVILFNYLNYPIFDVFLNRVDIGVANSYGGGRAVMSEVSIPFGIQELTWRNAGSGDKNLMKNKIVLDIFFVGEKSNYVGVHIYPDETAEMIFSEKRPDPSIRGEQIYKEKNLYGR